VIPTKTIISQFTHFSEYTPECDVHTFLRTPLIHLFHKFQLIQIWHKRNHSYWKIFYTLEQTLQDGMHGKPKYSFPVNNT